MVTNPFPGPQPYRAADRDRFFGRSDMAHKLRASILASRCMTVHGPSGAGKSSLMQAAVLPMLNERNDARIIRVDAWPEGEEPTQWLATAISAEFAIQSIPGDEAPRETVFKTVRGAARASSRPLVIYLDQLEQLLFSHRTPEETQPFFDCVEELVDMPLRTVRVVLSLREDYLGRFRDRLRDFLRITEGGFRVGPLNVGELTDAVVQAAATGEPPQDWSAEEMRELMMQVRMPGQAATDEAEAQSAYAQIICRALFQERAAGKTMDVTEAEPILRGYLESTVADLGELRKTAELLLEDHLVGSDGSRTLRTEKELARVVSPADLALILKQLEGAAILRAEEHHGSRYFEIGHDWLARRVYERRNAREQALALEREREETRKRLEQARRQRRFYASIAGVSMSIAAGAVALGLYARGKQAEAERATQAATVAEQASKTAEAEAKNKAIEASDARLLAGFRELRNRNEVAWGMKLLHDVQKPKEARGWLTLANDALQNGALFATLRGSEQAFGMAAWSPDGAYIAAGGSDGKVWIWSASGEGAAVSMAIHEKAIWSIAFSPDGKRLLTASEDGTAKSFDAQGKDKPIVFDAQAGPLRNAVFSPKGDRIAVLAGDSIARVWQADGSGLVSIKGHGAPITSLAFSPDGSSLITASLDKTARITAIDGSSKAVVLRGHQGAVRHVAPSPDGAFVVTGSDDKSARIWAASGKGTPVKLQGHRDAVIHAVFSPDGERVATVSRDKSGRVWAVDGKSPPIEFHAEGLALESLAFRKDGRYLLASSSEHSLVVWPASGGTPRTIEAHQGPLCTAIWSPDGQAVLSAAGIPRTGSARDTTVKVWRFNHLEALPHRRKPFFHSAAIPPGGDRATAAFDDRTVGVFSLDGSGEAIRLAGHEDWVMNVAISADGLYALSTSADKTARLWKLDGKAEPIVFRGAGGIARAGALSPDGKHVAVASDDKKIRLWKAEGGAPEKEFSGHGDIITSLSFGPTGSAFVSASMDQRARIWPADGSGTAIELKGHRGGIIAVAWSEDGARLATASEDTTVRVWNAKTAEFLFSLQHDGPVLALAFGGAGKYLATSSLKNGLRVWNADGSGDSLEIPVDSPIVALAFKEGGKRMVALCEDNTTRSFVIDVELAMKELELANRDCLPPEQRGIYMGETADLAKSRYEACEYLAKRIPDTHEGASNPSSAIAQQGLREGEVRVALSVLPVNTPVEVDKVQARRRNGMVELVGKVGEERRVEIFLDSATKVSRVVKIEAAGVSPPLIDAEEESKLKTGPIKTPALFDNDE